MTANIKIPLIKFSGPAPKKKYKTYNPINIAIPKAQKDLIRSVPRASLKRCAEGICDANDWFNLTIRMKLAYEISLIVYTEETQGAIKEIFDLLNVVRDRRTEDKKWVFSKEELLAIEDGLDAVDEIEDQTTRRVQLEAWHSARKFMTQFVGTT